jgi:hypothetical protein
MIMRLVIILASILVLAADLIVRIVRQASSPLGTKGTHRLKPQELYMEVITQLESLLDEKVDKLLATVAEIEAHTEQFRQIGYELTEVSLLGNPLPGITLEMKPCFLSDDATFQELLHQEFEHVTVKMVVKILQYVTRYQRKYQFRGLSCKRVSIRISKEPSVQIVYQQMPKGA